MPQAQGTSAAWRTYLASDNADETVAKVRTAGGQVLAEPVDVMDQVRVAGRTDPGGAVFGIWQARKNIGIGLANEPGSLAWSENLELGFRAHYSLLSVGIRLRLQLYGPRGAQIRCHGS